MERSAYTMAHLVRNPNPLYRNTTIFVAASGLEQNTMSLRIEPRDLCFSQSNPDDTALNHYLVRELSSRAKTFTRDY
jgi:hypothetical protein